MDEDVIVAGSTVAWDRPPTGRVKLGQLWEYQPLDGLDEKCFIVPIRFLKIFYADSELWSCEAYSLDRKMFERRTLEFPHFRTRLLVDQ